MKNLVLKIMVIAGFLGFLGCKKTSDPSTWSDKQLNKWFEKGEWLNGWKVTPDVSINRKAFAVSYYQHKERWDKAFKFLKESDLQNMELKKYEIEGTELFAPISEYMSKNEETARYEAHKKYIDIQYVVSGKELIGIAPASQVKEVLEPYNEEKDIMFVTVNQINNFEALPDRFFIFFPDDIHRPGLKDGENSPVRKAVVKVKVD
jgi:YhcH/YjgK/YiaL family protein